MSNSQLLIEAGKILAMAFCVGFLVTWLMAKL